MMKTRRALEYLSKTSRKKITPIYGIGAALSLYALKITSEKFSYVQKQIDTLNHMTRDNEMLLQSKIISLCGEYSDALVQFKNHPNFLIRDMPLVNPYILACKSNKCPVVHEGVWSIADAWLRTGFYKAEEIVRFSCGPDLSNGSPPVWSADGSEFVRILSAIVPYDLYRVGMEQLNNLNLSLHQSASAEILAFGLFAGLAARNIYKSRHAIKESLGNLRKNLYDKFDL